MHGGLALNGIKGHSRIVDGGANAGHVELSACLITFAWGPSLQPSCLTQERGKRVAASAGLLISGFGQLISYAGQWAGQAGRGCGRGVWRRRGDRRR